MTAYLIFSQVSIQDQAELDAYSKLVPATLAGHPAKLLVRYGALEVLEGEASEGVVVLSFPSAADAKAYYSSPEYQAALPHRLAGATYNVVLVEGLDASAPRP